MRAAAARELAAERFLGYGVQGLGFRVQGSGFRVVYGLIRGVFLGGRYGL